jgi:hypothetical protein
LRKLKTKKTRFVKSASNFSRILQSKNKKMFQDEKNTDEIDELQAKTPDHDSAPLNLMHIDLAEIKNPAATHTPAEKKDLPKTVPVSVLFSERQKSSPFLSQLPTEKPQEKISEKPTEKPLPKPQEKIPEKPAEIKENQKNEPLIFSPMPAPSIKREIPKPFAPLPSKNIPPKEAAKTAPLAENVVLGKMIFAFALFFFLIILGASGYYFWITREDSTSETTEKQNQAASELEKVLEDSNQVAPPIEQPVEAPLEISLEKVNFISVDITNVDKVVLENKIEAYLKKAEELNITSPAEFVLTDLDKTPLSFKVFSEKLGLTLPADISSLLKNTFSLFINNDNGNYRLGLAVDSSNDLKLKNALRKAESQLSESFSPLLKNPENKDLANGDYTENVYKKITIRFFNLVSPEYLSLDYAVFNKKLVIGTTRKAMYDLLDYLLAPKKQTAINQKESLPTKPAAPQKAAIQTETVSAPLANTL